jgi:putative addiction module killer protein
MVALLYWYRICYHMLLPQAVVEYLDARNRSPFGAWFRRLDATAAARVTLVLLRIEQGVLTSVRSVGGGIFEYRIDAGPGYRTYFGKDGGQLVVLLGGSTKRRQQVSIDAAKAAWRDYHARREVVPLKSWH